MKKIISLLSTFCAAASVASAQITVLNDNFNSATVSGGVVSSAINYGPATASNSHTLGTGTLDGSPALRVGGGAGSIYLTANLGQTISLTSVGDYIQATFDFATTGADNGNRVLRFGFYESGATDLASVGYSLAGGNAGTGNSVLNVETSTSANNFYTNGGVFGGGTQTQTTRVSGDTYQALLRVERTSATEMTVTGTWAGTALAANVHTITGSSAIDIDQLWFGVHNRSAEFLIDNLVVTAIPEPSTYAVLFGLAALALVARMRRRG
jgi:hypothetical protein